ncbi:MAG: hypothetical protein WEB50_03630 [Vicinamibacterales bacterium]
MGCHIYTFHVNNNTSLSLTTHSLPACAAVQHGPTLVYAARVSDTMSWFWIGLAVVLPFVVGLGIAWPFWRKPSRDRESGKRCRILAAGERRSNGAMMEARPEGQLPTAVTHYGRHCLQEGIVTPTIENYALIRHAGNPTRQASDPGPAGLRGVHP